MHLKLLGVAKSCMANRFDCMQHVLTEFSSNHSTINDMACSISQVVSQNFFASLNHFENMHCCASCMYASWHNCPEEAPSSGMPQGWACTPFNCLQASFVCVTHSTQDQHPVKDQSL